MQQGNIMKLGEALSNLKKERTRLARLITLRKENVFVEKGKQTVFSPKQLSEEIDKKTNEIRILKLQIQTTNLQTKLKLENMSLAEALLKINDIRNKIEKLSSLFERKRELWSREEEKELVPQLDENKIEEEIKNLESEKVKLDNIIQMTNWNTELHLLQ